MLQWWGDPMGERVAGQTCTPVFLCDWFWSTYIHMNSVGHGDLTVTHSRRDQL